MFENKISDVTDYVVIGDLLGFTNFSIQPMISNPAKACEQNFTAVMADHFSISITCNQVRFFLFV